jgi:dCMP deaminase
MNKSKEWDLTFLRIAKELGDKSHCVSRQVGCLFVLDGRILVSGINGTPPGEKNCDELFDKQNFDPAEHRAWSDVAELHAEQNAIVYAAKKGISLEGSTLYCTLQPCIHCSKLLLALGVKRVVFGNYYDRVDMTSVTRFNSHNIEYEYLPFV